MNLDTALFRSAIGDTTVRPRALADLQHFLEAGGDPNLRLDDILAIAGSWPLLSAGAYVAWEDAVRVLLAAGANPHARTDHALRCAAIGGYLPVVDRLLGAGADVHAENDEALRWAANNNHLPVVERLLAAGANVHARRDDALHRAAEHGHLPVVECLLAHGADAVRVVAVGRPDVKPAICETLDAVAAAIPVNQRQELLARSLYGFPALRALIATEQRRSTSHHVTPHHRDRHP